MISFWKKKVALLLLSSTANLYGLHGLVNQNHCVGWRERVDSKELIQNHVKVLTRWNILYTRKFSLNSTELANSEYNAYSALKKVIWMSCRLICSYLGNMLFLWVYQNSPCFWSKNLHFEVNICRSPMDGRFWRRSRHFYLGKLKKVVRWNVVIEFFLRALYTLYLSFILLDVRS